METSITNMVVCIMVVFGALALAGCAHAMRPEQGVISFFSSDCQESRKKFIEASHAAGASIENIKNPMTGPGGDTLFTDVTAIGAKDAKNIIVLGSGTHGVEGFTGSAIQAGLLREGIATNLKPDTKVVMIHAINPYGFAHLRRFNENNIDLNHNFVDHSNVHPTSAGYGELADALLPKTLSMRENARSIIELFWYWLRNGTDKLKQAVTQGQYSHPEGLFYGGQSETWSNKTIRTIVRCYLSNAERVVFIDFHTGLGPYGNAEVILNEASDSPAYKRAVEIWGDQVKTTVSGESVSVHLQGTLKLAVPKMLPDAEVTAVSLEFGTFSPTKVLWALRSENWLHHCGGKEHPDNKEIKAELLRVFYPNDDKWKERVWNQGQEIVEQALVHLQ
jgi:Protein of unknown function (DUF2817)